MRWQGQIGQSRAGRPGTKLGLIEVCRAHPKGFCINSPRKLQLRHAGRRRCGGPAAQPRDEEVHSCVPDYRQLGADFVQADCLPRLRLDRRPVAAHRCGSAPARFRLHAHNRLLCAELPAWWPVYASSDPSLLVI